MKKFTDQQFENLVRRITRRVVLSEAYNRQKFIDTTGDILEAAFGEWVKYKTAQLNGLTIGWDVEGNKVSLQEKWRREYLSLLNDNFALKVIKRVKGCKDTEKAFRTALDEAHGGFLHSVDYAVPYVQQCFRLLQPPIEVPWDATKEFFDLVWEIFNKNCKTKKIKHK